MLRRLPADIAGNGRSTFGRINRRLAGTHRLLLLTIALLLVRLALYAAVAGQLGALPDALCQWDCGWYRDIMLYGYDARPVPLPGPTFGQADWAFFPAFPLMTRGLSDFARMSYELSGIILANVFLGVFALYAGKFLERHNPDSNPAALAVFLFSFPYSLYFSVPYTESAYAALTMMSFYYVSRGDMLAASLSACLLAGTRITGILLTPVIAAHYAVRIFRACARRDGAQAAAILRAAMLPLAVAPLGLFLFMLFMYWRFGDAFAFIHIERSWGRPAQDPLLVFFNGLFSFDLQNTISKHGSSFMFGALSVLCGILMSLRLLSARRYAESWFLTMSILLPLSHGLNSITRYIFANPIFLVFLFDTIWRSKYRAFFKEIIFVSVVVQLWFVALWIRTYAFLS